jgi:hypothetical protein
MTYYKMNGAKFETLEELIEDLWPVYESRMSRDEFEAYAKENAEVIDE